jgi:hypothetical protein
MGFERGDDPVQMLIALCPANLAGHTLPLSRLQAGVAQAGSLGFNRVSPGGQQTIRQGR